MERNIFVDCGNKQVIRRILGGRSASSYDVAKTQFNTYMFDGEFESTGGIVENYDVTGNCLETDPGFKDARTATSPSAVQHSWKTRPVTLAG